MGAWEGVSSSVGRTCGGWVDVSVPVGRSCGACVDVSIPAGRSGGVWGDASVTSGVSGGEVCIGTGCASAPLAGYVDPAQGSSWGEVIAFPDDGDVVEGWATLGRLV